MSIKPITDQTFDKIIQAADVPVVVDVWASWCHLCKLQAAYLEDAAHSHADGAQFFTLNADENPAVVRRFKIFGLPALLYFHGGKLIVRKTGVQSVAAINAQLMQLTPAAMVSGVKTSVLSRLNWEWAVVVFGLLLAIGGIIFKSLQ